MKPVDTSKQKLENKIMYWIWYGDLKTDDTL